MSAAQPARRALLDELVRLRRSLPEILLDLERTRLVPEYLVSVTRRDLSEILGRVRSGDLVFADAVAWAREVRLIDDIGREEGWHELVNTILFELASPELDDRSEEQRLKDWRGLLLGLSVEGGGGAIAEKHRSIVELIRALRLRDRGWVQTHEWDGDTCAAAFARDGDLRRVVYVSVWNLSPGRYYYEYQTPNGPDATDYEVVDRAEDVDFETLAAAMERHLAARKR